MIVGLLSDVTERSKRNLLVFSSISIFLGLTEQLPEKVPLLGISLEASTEQELISYGLILFQLYLLVRYVSFVLIDLRNNREERKKQGMDESHRFYSYKVIEQTILQKLGVFIDFAIYHFASGLNALVEIVVPVIYGLFGLYFAKETLVFVMVNG